MLKKLQGRVGLKIVGDRGQDTGRKIPYRQQEKKKPAIWLPEAGGHS